jgi:putative hydroxymethylpyrimidine transporter CytX
MSSFNLFLLWFGAAVSVAEILTGGLLADLGLGKGMTAVVLGHLAGIVPLALAGFIGYRERLPSIKSTRISFGRQGSYLVSVLNVLQLVGWTAVMVQQGGMAVNELTKAMWSLDNASLAMAGVGGLVGLWVLVEMQGFRLMNMVAVALLFGLTIAMSFVVFGQPAAGGVASPQAVAPFGMGFELSIIMPLSWFPLIADYTSQARTRTGSWLAPCLGYLLGSTWMYAIGLFGAVHTGSADPTGMMLAAGLGTTALLVVILATVTTTYLDVYSAAISTGNVVPGLDRRVVSLVYTALGTGLALAVPSDLYMDFLYLIGSVFAPLVAVLLIDYFVLRTDRRDHLLDLTATASLAVGVVFYHLIKSADIPIGPTLATIAFTSVLHPLLRLAGRRQTGRAAAQA